MVKRLLRRSAGKTAKKAKPKIGKQIGGIKTQSLTSKQKRALMQNIKKAQTASAKARKGKGIKKGIKVTKTFKKPKKAGDGFFGTISKVAKAINDDFNTASANAIAKPFKDQAKANRIRKVRSKRAALLRRTRKTRR